MHYISGRGKSYIYFFQFIVHDDKMSFINFTVGATLLMLLIFTVFCFNPLKKMTNPDYIGLRLFCGLDFFFFFPFFLFFSPF